MGVSGAKESIDAALEGWSGITAQPHRFGGTEYRLGRREIGHVHGDHLVDIPCRKKFVTSWWPLVAPNHTTFSLRAAG